MKRWMVGLMVCCLSVGVIGEIYVLPVVAKVQAVLSISGSAQYSKSPIDSIAVLYEISADKAPILITGKYSDKTVKRFVFQEGILRGRPYLVIVRSKDIVPSVRTYMYGWKMVHAVEQYLSNSSKIELRGESDLDSKIHRYLTANGFMPFSSSGNGTDIVQKMKDAVNKLKGHFPGN